jgi:Bacterial dnaA protein helix-turn-helix
MIISYMAIPGIPRRPYEFKVPVVKQIEIVVVTVSNYYNVNTCTIYQPKKGDRNQSDAKHSAMYLMKKIIGMGPVQISNELRMNHTSVCFGIEKIKGLMEFDAIFENRMRLLSKGVEMAFSDYKKQLHENTVQVSKQRKAV